MYRFDMLFLFFLRGISRHFFQGILCFLIHNLAFPFPVDDFTDVHFVEVRKVNEGGHVRQIGPGFPSGDGSGRHVKPFCQLLLGQPLFLAQAFE